MKKSERFSNQSRRRFVFPIFLIIFVGLFCFESFSSLFAADWRYRKEMGDFVCWSNVDITQHKSEFESLFQIQEELTKRLQLPEIQEPIDLYIYEDQSVWQHFLKTEHPDQPYRDAFFIKKSTVFRGEKSRYRVYLYLSPKFGDDLRHEGTHAILNASLRRNLPTWLDEGLAEYYEKRSDRTQNESWLPLVQRRMKSREFKELKKLEKVTGVISEEHYGDSWAWVCFLLNGPRQVQAILPEYIADLSARKLFLSSVSSRLDKIGITQKHCQGFFQQLNRFEE